MLTGVGGGLLLAKNCAIMCLRTIVEADQRADHAASRQPDDDEPAHHPDRTRARLLGDRLARDIGFGHDVHVMHFLQLPAAPDSDDRRGPDGGNRGFVKSDSAENEFAKLAFEIGGIAVGQTRHGRHRDSAAISTV